MATTMIWLTGIILNFGIMLVFRQAFAEQGKTGKQYWFFVAIISLLSYLMWAAVLLVLVVDIAKYVRKRRNQPNFKSNNEE